MLFTDLEALYGSIFYVVFTFLVSLYAYYRSQEEAFSSSWAGAGILLSYQNYYVLGITFNKEKNMYICEYPGGKVEKGIDFSATHTACRELAEETGLYVSTKDIKNVNAVISRGNESDVYLFEYELSEIQLEYIRKQKNRFQFEDYFLVDKEEFKNDLKTKETLKFTVEGKTIELRKFNKIMLNKLFN